MSSEEQIQAARIELAKRELAKRQSVSPEPSRKKYLPPASLTPGGIMGDPAIMEPLKSMLSGQVANSLGGIAGIGQTGLNAAGLSDTPPEDIVKGYQDALTYRPQDSRAQQNIQDFGKMVEPVMKAVDSTRTGEETFQKGGGPALSTANQMLPDIVGAMMGLKGVTSPPRLPSTPHGTMNSMPIPMKMDSKTGRLVNAMSNKGKIRSDISAQKPTARTAKYTVTPAGRLVGETLAKKAVSAGWDDSFVAWVKTTDKQTRQNLREMVNIAKKRVGEGKEFTYNGRPSDIIGKSLKTRIDLVKKVQRQSGSLIKKVSKQQLSGKQIDISEALNKFKSQVFELGGKINEKGEIEFGINSQLYGQASKQKAFKDVFAKINTLGDVADGYNAHQLKQFITEYVDFGKGSKDGISANVENVLKGFRKDINDTLKGQSDAYDKVNTSYSQTTQALSDFQKAAGKSIDLFGPEADAATGRVLRKLLSNMQNRENLAATMKAIEDVAVKHGGKYTDDLTAQTKAVNEMERLLGSFAETSFKGEITQAGQRVAENPSIRQLGTEAVRMSAKQLQKTKQNQTAQIRALEELIYRGGE